MNRCTCCSDTRRKEIDRAIVTGGNLSKIAKEFSISYNSVYRHSRVCISRQLSKGAEIAQKNHSLNVMTELDDLMTDTRQILEEARDKQHNGLALKAIQQLRGNLTLVASIQAEIHRQQQQTNIIEVTEKKGVEDAMIREGLASLSPQERKTFMELSFKAVCGMGKRYEEEVPGPPLDLDTTTGEIINPIKVLRNRTKC